MRPRPVEDARRVADKLDIPYYVLNFRDVFEDKVIKDFVQTYASGMTPNPCIRCNGGFRFAELLSFAKRVGAARLAVRGGSLAGPFREATIASTLQRMRKDGVAVGRDERWFGAGAAGVTLVIADVSLGGA